MSRRPDAGVTVDLSVDVPDAPPVGDKGQIASPSGPVTEPFPGEPETTEDPRGIPERSREAIDRARALLTTDVGRLDFRVTRDEAREALQILAGLPRGELAHALDELNRDGTLEAMLEALPAGERMSLLKVAAEKGVIDRQPPTPASGRFDPPDFPALYQMDVRLPRCVNDLIHEHSRTAVEGYKAAFDAYVERYAGAVAACQSEAELRALGKPAAPFSSTWELTDYRDPKADAYAADWNLNRSQASSLHAYQAVSDRLGQLGNQRPDGTVFFEAQAEGHLGTYAGKGSLAVDSSGGVEATAVPGQALSKGNLEGSQVGSVRGYLDGSINARVKVGPVAITASMDMDGNVTGVGGTVRMPLVGVGVGFGVTSDEVTLQADVVGIDTERLKGAIGSYATYSHRRQEVSGGVQGKLEVGPHTRVTGSVGIGATGITPATVERAMGDGGIFEQEGEPPQRSE